MYNNNHKPWIYDFAKYAIIIYVTFTLLLPSRTQAEPTVFPTGLTIKDESKVEDALILYRSGTTNEVFLIDTDGNELNRWVSPWDGYNIGILAKPLPNRRILTALRAQGSRERTLVELNWEGEIVWQFHRSGYDWIHHDFQRMENGNTLILATRLRSAPEIHPVPIRDDFIYEIDYGGTILWVWSALDHFDHFNFSEEDLQDIRSRRGNGEYFDLWHTNSIQPLPKNKFAAKDSRFKPGNILVSARNPNMIYIIDKESGDIVWRCRDKTIRQHHASMIPSENLGAGRIIVFDNGGYGGYGEKKIRFHSRIPEINPLTMRIKREYNANMSKRPLSTFFSQSRAGVHMLPNSRYFITEALRGRMFLVGRRGKIFWEYIDPNFSDRASDDYMNIVYRAYWIDKEWLDGVFPPWPW